MQISFDPRDAESVNKAAEMLGLGQATEGADADAQKGIIDRLQAQLAEKRQEIAKLKAAGDKASEPAPSITDGLQEPAGVSGDTFAACIMNLPDAFLLKWPAIGKGGLVKMREFAQENFDLEPAEAEEEPAPPKKKQKKESPTPSGPEEKSSGEDTDDLDDWGAEDEGPEEEAEPKHTLQDIRGLIQSKFIKAGNLPEAKAIIKKCGFVNLPDIPAGAFDRVYKALKEA